MLQHRGLLYEYNYEGGCIYLSLHYYLLIIATYRQVQLVYMVQLF